MRLSTLLSMAALAVLVWPQSAAAQDPTACSPTVAECLVDWDLDGDFVPENNALRNTIANDTDRPADRVYVLRRGGLYYIEDRIANADFDLRLVGQTRDEAAIEDLDCPPGETNPDNCDDFGPAVIQRVTREDGSIDGVMIESAGDGNGGQVLKNVWLQGQSDDGVTANYEPIVINSTNSRFEYDGVIFDRNDWHHLGFKAGGNDIYVRNSLFRNLSDANPTQRYGGRAIRLEAGADTVVFENNSFFNLTSFPFQSEAAPVEYFVFNHNTLVNFGLTFAAGNIWKRAYIANNVMVNPFWQGESADQYNAPDRADGFTGVFQIGALPGRFGLEQDRRIVFSNNNLYRQPALETFYGSLDPIVRAQPIISDTTQGFVDADPEHRIVANNTQLMPGLTNAPTDAATLAQMTAFIEDAATPGTPTPWAVVYWDPGRIDNPLAINWPVPEDFTYSNSTLQTAGTDGLPLGDLNWYPTAKASYLANREANIAAIENLAGMPAAIPTSQVVAQGEGATITGGSVVAVEGFTSFFIESGGFIEWAFDVPADGTYGLDILTDLRGSDPRGENVLIDGEGLRNYDGGGEYFFCTAAWTGGTCPQPLDTADGWDTQEVRSEYLIDDTVGRLDLTAGAHTLRITPSWGYQAFSTINVVDASGATVDELTPPEAVSEGVREECEAEGFCPQGFQYAALDAGGSITWTVTLQDGEGSILPRFLYQAPAGATGEVFVNGASAGMLTFPVADGDAAVELAGPQVTTGPGTHTVTLTTSSGGLNLDYAIFNIYEGGDIATEGLPEGWALGNAFPNPTAGTATIRFGLAEAADVRLDVFDVLGRRVTTLADGPMTAGTHTARLDTGALASGTYVYRLTTPVGAETRRLTVIR